MSPYNDSELDESASVTQWPVRRHTSRALDWLAEHWGEISVVLLAAGAMIVFVDMLMNGLP